MHEKHRVGGGQCFSSSFAQTVLFILFFVTISKALEFLRILSGIAGLLSEGKISRNITEQFIMAVKATVTESEK